MMCERCGINEAVIHTVSLSEGKYKTVHLCEECFSQSGQDAAENLSLEEVVTSLIQQKAQKAEEENQDDREDNIRCDGCGISLKDFKTIGRLGCPRCYKKFEGLLKKLLPRIQHGLEHAGKAPKKWEKSPGKASKRSWLKKQMDMAVKKEEYEKAARFRDELKKIESSAG